MSDFVGLPYEKTSNESKGAAASMVAHAPNQRQRIWQWLHTRGGAGATCDEVEMYLDIVHASASTRLLELRRMGRIETIGVRKTRSQRKAAVYVTVEPENWLDKSDGWPTPHRLSKAQVRRIQTAEILEIFEEMADAIRGNRQMQPNPRSELFISAKLQQLRAILTQRERR